MIAHILRCTTKFLIFSSVLLCWKGQSFSQSFIGHIASKNYTKQEYKAGTQNWAIEQDKQGRLYFANNEGLLTFDGTKWQLFPLPNNTIVRSIFLGNDGKLYTGGQDEVGYYKADKVGRLIYFSLKELISDEHKQFADIWNIVPMGNEVFFRSSSRIFRLQGDKMTAYRPVSKWAFLGKDHNRLIAHDKDKGLMQFQNGNWDVIIEKKNLPEGLNITSITPYENESIITTTQNGIFKLSGNRLIRFMINGLGIKNEQFFTSAIVVNNGEILLGSYDSGIYHLDAKGDVIKNFSSYDGLKNNDVKCIFKDSHKNIWLGLEDGISFLNLNNPVKWLNPKEFNDAAGYAATLFQNKIFFALANGIYEMPYSKTADDFISANIVKRIADGLSWKVSTLSSHLFAGREDGFFEIKSEKLIPVDKATGYWVFKSLSDKSNPLSFVAGNYLGVSFYNEKNGTFFKSPDSTFLNTSSRFVEYDSVLHVIWVSHPYRGIYKISPTGNFIKLFTAKDGLPSDLNNHVFKIKNKILIATISGIYEYNTSKNTFEISAYYDKIFHGISLRYLQDDPEGNLWFIHEKEVGVVDHSNNSIIYFPEVRRKILSGFEHILPIDKDNVLIGGEQGFFNINYKKYLQNVYAPEVHINNVTFRNNKDSILFGGFGEINNNESKQSVRLSSKWNSFYFEFSSPYYEQLENVEYSYYLKGFDKDWSEWSKKGEKDYTNIPPGNYTFLVKARNNLNKESAVASYSFHINPPWYNSWWSWILYCISAIYIIYALWERQKNKLKHRQAIKLAEERKKFEEEQNSLENMHQLEMEKSEKELIKLKNEKLESEIDFKNAELASMAMNMVQKKEFLLKIKDELNKIKQLNDSGKNTVETSELKKLLRSFSEQTNIDEDWEQFSLLFNKMHRDFLVLLKEKFPDIKPHEMKLCAYLRMNLSSKEIAHLMSISVRGVEISRYRLRKKLQVPAKEDLFQFLFNLESGTKNNSM